MYTSTKTYNSLPADNLLSMRSNYSFGKTGIKAMPTPLKSRQAVHPELLIVIDFYCTPRKSAIIKCFLDHDLKASNIMEVFGTLMEEIMDIHKAMAAADMTEAKKQLDDLDVKTSCLNILSTYIYKIYPV